MGINFAEGLAKAVSAVLDVLTQMGNAIAHWLAPGSPPRLLPDIDKWGQSAMDEFLGGFGSADFGIFNDLGGTIEKAMRGFAKTDSKGLVPNILGSREAVASAVDEFKRTGDVTEETIQKIVRAAGSGGPMMEGYTRALFGAARANAAVTTAQEALSQVTARYQGLLRPLNEELGAIAQRRQDIIDEQRAAELQAIVSDENAPALAKELAQMELREMELKKQIQLTEQQQVAAEGAAQTELSAAEEAAAAADEQLAIQQATMDAQLQNNALMKEQADLLARLGESLVGALGAGGAGGLAGKGLANLSKGLGGIPSLASVAGGAFGGIQERLSQFAEDMKAPFAGIKEQFNQFKVAWAQAGLAFIARLTPMSEALHGAWGPGGTWEGNMNNLKTISGLLVTRWGEQWGEGGTWAGIMENASTIATEQWGEGGVWSGIMDNSGTAVELLGERWGDVWGEGGVWQGIMENADSILSTLWSPDKGTWNVAMQTVKEFLRELRTDGLDFLKTGLERLIAPISTFIGWLGDLKDAIAAIDLSAIFHLLGQSPSPFEKSLYGINAALRTVSSSGFPALQTAMNRTPPISLPMSQSQAASRSVSHVTNINNHMGGNNINNGMDVAFIEAVVERVLVRELS